MKISNNGIAKLAQWEGNRKYDGVHYPYDDYDGKIKQLDETVHGYLTMGYGHLLTQSELRNQFVDLSDNCVGIWTGLSEGQAQQLFDKDLYRFEKAVNEHVEVNLSQNQYEALVSFSFNVGVGAFTSSTLLRRLNEGDYDEVPNQLRRWNKSGGVVVQGLINRREHEIEHWLR